MVPGTDCVTIHMLSAQIDRIRDRRLGAVASIEESRLEGAPTGAYQCQVVADARLPGRRFSGRLTDGLMLESGLLDFSCRKFLSGVCFTSDRCRPGGRMVIGKKRPTAVIGYVLN